MAIYHGHLKILSRSDRNTVQAIAYRTGTDLYDERTGKWFYYSSKKDVIHVELILPENAPQWAKDLQLKIARDRISGIQELSNIAEGAENRKNSRVWREFEFALPKELTEEQNKAAARAFLEKQASRFKVGVVASFHMKEDPHTGQELLHCHATFMEREMTEQGLCKNKQRFLDNPEFLTTLRVDWMIFGNEWLEACGHDVRIDHRSYAARGIDILPQPKRGRGVEAMEERIVPQPKPTISEMINHPGTVFDSVTQQYAAFNSQSLAQNTQEPEDQTAVVSQLSNTPCLMLSRARVAFKSALVFSPEMKIRKEVVNSSLSPQLPSQFQQTGADSGLRSVAVTTTLMSEFSSFPQGISGVQSLKTPLGAALHQQVPRSLLNSLPTLAFDPESCTSSGLDLWQMTAGRPGSFSSSLALDHGSYDRPACDAASLSRRLEFDKVRHQNVAKIIAKPTTVLDIVTRQQSTFMWGEVEKTLARYVKEEPIYQRLEAQLKNSAELILLREAYHKREDGTVENVSVYTTRSVLTQELSLMDLAQMLGARQRHGLSEVAVAKAIETTRQEMAAKGHDLSPDQLVALRHVTQGDQLSCVIGYAGAGKSTMMKTAKMAWEADGYQVYGLAPTGRAAQNLEEIGLKSQTVHKFLRDYKNGRAQYRPKSVLIVDEAGMVDVSLFSGLLQAADRLGVKVVVVGDGAQNQPYGRGNGLRVITDVLRVQKMDTVVRQQVEWQREATRLFGGYDTKEALRLYLDHGHVHFIDEKVPSLKKLVARGHYEEVVELYNLSRRVTGSLWQVIERDTAPSSGKQAQHHQDFE